MKDINFGAFESLYDFYTAFPNEETCIAYLEKVLWPNGVVSPYDVSSKVYKRGDGYYRCKNTGKNFNVRIGTIFENTKIPLRKWFLAMYFVANHKKGISATQLSSNNADSDHAGVNSNKSSGKELYFILSFGERLLYRT